MPRAQHNPIEIFSPAHGNFRCAQFSGKRARPWRPMLILRRLTGATCLLCERVQFERGECPRPPRGHTFIDNPPLSFWPRSRPQPPGCGSRLGTAPRHPRWGPGPSGRVGMPPPPLLEALEACSPAARAARAITAAVPRRAAFSPPPVLPVHRGTCNGGAKCGGKLIRRPAGSTPSNAHHHHRPKSRAPKKKTSKLAVSENFVRVVVREKKKITRLA